MLAYGTITSTWTAHAKDRVARKLHENQSITCLRVQGSAQELPLPGAGRRQRIQAIGKVVELDPPRTAESRRALRGPRMAPMPNMAWSTGEYVLGARFAGRPKRCLCQTHARQSLRRNDICVEQMRRQDTAETMFVSKCRPRA